MENFKHLDSKTIELAGVAASVAGGCRPCLAYHFKKALEVGCTIDQVKESVELGKMIKQRPTQIFFDETGKEYYRHVGYFPEEELVKILQVKGIKLN